MVEQKIYLICRPCSDSWYEGHPSKVAWNTREEAQKYMERNDLYIEDDEHNCSHYIQEVTLYSM